MFCDGDAPKSAGMGRRDRMAAGFKAATNSFRRADGVLGPTSAGTAPAAIAAKKCSSNIFPLGRQNRITSPGRMPDVRQLSAMSEKDAFAGGVDAGSTSSTRFKKSWITWVANIEASLNVRN